MKSIIAAGALAVALGAATHPARAGDAPATVAPHVRVVRTAAPEKKLDFDVAIPAAPHDVWHAIGSGDGLATWFAPAGLVDLRPGGEWTGIFAPGVSLGGVVVAVVPEKALTLNLQSPPDFTEMRRIGSLTLITLAPLEAGATRVHLTHTGWRSGGEWDFAYELYARRDAELLEALYVRFVKGPTDWSTLRASAGA